jgi:hypothetical protein
MGLYRGFAAALAGTSFGANDLKIEKEHPVLY